MDFLKKFEKAVEKTQGITGAAQPPRYWFSSGNYVLNYILSGRFDGVVAQGRVHGLAGPSGAGKSFIMANMMREAQKAGAHVLAVDSENALDEDFVEAIGVSTDPAEWTYKSVVTIPHVIKVVSSFLNAYRDAYSDNLEDAPQIFIGIDSLDMLMTETEYDNVVKGKSSGDQGQRNKQLKAMLRSFVQTIKDLNVSIVCNSQVYANQDMLNGEGKWIVSDAVRYSMSMIALLTKLKLKDDNEAGKFAGIRLRAQGFKTRFTKPFQKVEIEVPYDTGMDPYTGILEAGENVGVVTRKGNRYFIKGEEDNLWFKKDFTHDLGKKILDQLMTAEGLAFDVDEGHEEVKVDTKKSVKKQRESLHGDSE